MAVSDSIPWDARYWANAALVGTFLESGATSMSNTERRLLGRPGRLLGLEIRRGISSRDWSDNKGDDRSLQSPSVRVVRSPPATPGGVLVAAGKCMSALRLPPLFSLDAEEGRAASVRSGSWGLTRGRVTAPGRAGCDRVNPWLQTAFETTSASRASSCSSRGSSRAASRFAGAVMLATLDFGKNKEATILVGVKIPAPVGIKSL
eukprot:CAMPEP_0204425850 /NCGR_PEP_ID=MMETSP0470-20130426/50561_1 /ASSEMBLY_ACC=CAM_ASM_000385 /TAXON_ID=2969 /ORGANISM="Oxyrrhis marina" /LENGTH=204 /DNA_ID=CAMNT_0051423499 /DNA_START=129 /DNA_END=743 /DNA_ORIENTATION=+